jgi:hypothetical protein
VQIIPIREERGGRQIRIVCSLPSLHLELLTTNSDLSLPPLGSLSLQHHAPPPPQPYQNVDSFAPPHQLSFSPGPAAAAHSYDTRPAPSASQPYQNPAPVAPMHPQPVMPTTWDPGMGIKFGGAPPMPVQNQNSSSARGQGGQATQSPWPSQGAWIP